MLWLWGRRGTGKTHLLQAACAAAGAQGGAATYLDLESAAARPALLEGCEALDLVCLDGLERVSEDAAWNAAIFRLHTLMQDGAGACTWRARRRRRRCASGCRTCARGCWRRPCTSCSELDEAGPGRGAASGARPRRGLELSREAAAYLVHRMPRDMHSLCGVLDRLDEAALAAQRRLTVPFLRQVLEADQAPAGPEARGMAPRDSAQVRDQRDEPRQAREQDRRRRRRAPRDWR